MLSLYDDIETQRMLADYLQRKRKQAKLSRQKLAEKAQVPASTIRHFEQTAQISLRQFLALWLVLDKMDRLVALTKEEQPLPKTIEEVLRG
ncbi:transcriptional regulator [Haemophilus paracuniculus]|uniref:Transcriptional regulator n=1 Tax=Haemophilus paracuniculus TaxID=734 RepID=A0A1T0ARI4_9PAST|nr:helix-turn-helix transcriptional regulator [Haemophilus paracuniculus]OOR98957.1 transcriptional regulator [Haemophilus paracuniculus]